MCLSKQKQILNTIRDIIITNLDVNISWHLFFFTQNVILLTKEKPNMQKSRTSLHQNYTHTKIEFQKDELVCQLFIGVEQGRRQTTQSPLRNLWVMQPLKFLPLKCRLVAFIQYRIISNSKKIFSSYLKKYEVFCFESVFPCLWGL